MAEIIQRIIWDDSQFGEGVNRSISDMNRVAAAGEDMQQQIDGAVSSMGASIDKSIAEANRRLGEFSNISDKQRKEWQDLLRSQLEFERRVREVFKRFRFLGIDVDKAALSLARFRTQVILKNKALEESTGKTTQAAKVMEQFGDVWGTIINLFANRFPIAGKAVITTLRAIRVALISTGIGAIVVLLGTLISTLIGVAKAFDETASEIKKTDIILNAFKATGQGLLGALKKLVENSKDVINGQKSFGQAVKDNIKALFDLRNTIPAVTEELNKATIASRKAKEAQSLLNTAISFSKDLLNRQREAASDSSKSIAERVSAIKKAGEIESGLENQRLKALTLEREAIAANLRARKIAGQDTKELTAELIRVQNEIRFAQAEANARQRADLRAINDLYKEGAERIKQFRDEYANFLEDLSQRVESARLEQLTGADRIRAELAVAINAIDDFEKKVQEAAKKARQSFDPTPFSTLRLFAEKKAAQELRDFEQNEALARVEREKQRLALLGQTLSASFDEQLNLEEAQAAFVLEAERAALEKRLKLRRDYYAASGKAQDEAAKDELKQLELNIELIQNKEAELLKKARERRLKEQLDAVGLDEQVNDLQLQIIRQSGDRTLTLEQFIEKERLKNKAAAIQKRIRLLEEFSGENDPEVRLLRAQLAAIEREIEEAGKSDVVSDFLKQLFKIDSDQLSFVQSSFQSAFSRIASAAETFTQIAIEQGRRRIDALSKEIDQTQALLERELALKEQGYANDYELYRQNLERLTAERDRVAQENLEKEKKIANTQLAINTAQQVSEYTLAAIKLFSGSAKLGPIVGVALALGAIGILASTVAQAKANAERFSQPPRFHEGGAVEGALHGFGGRKIEVEGGEFVVRSSVAQKNIEFLEALNAGKFQHVDFDKLFASRIDISPTLKKMERDREVIVQASEQINYEILAQIYSKAMTKVSDDIIGYLKTRPVEKLDSSGNIVKEWVEGNNIRRQRVLAKN